MQMDEIQEIHGGKFSIDPTPKALPKHVFAANYEIAERHPGGIVLKRWTGKSYVNFEAAKEAALVAAKQWLAEYRPANG
jgi:hypothetical protein